MPRIRTIKPEFWRSPDVMALDYFQRLLFIGLWNLADDEGRGVYDPSAIAADLFLTEYSLSPHGVLTEVSNAFLEYEKRGMIAVFEANFRQYFQIVHWAEHQKPNRPSRSKFPAPTSENIISLNAHGGLTEDSVNTHGGLTAGTGNREQGTGNRETYMSEASSDVGTKPTRATYPEDFEQWWRTYPRHKNASKKQALDSWRKATKHIDAGTLLSLTERYARTHGISDESKIPHPTTWLNQERWETVDEHDTPAAPKPVGDGNTIAAWLGQPEPDQQPGWVDAEFWETTETRGAIE